MEPRLSSFDAGPAPSPELIEAPYQIEGGEENGRQEEGGKEGGKEGREESQESRQEEVVAVAGLEPGFR